MQLWQASDYGSSSLHSNKKWWIGEAIVATDRGRGIGKTLMRTTAAFAKACGIEELFLYTPDQEDYCA
jgi:N-acetylglutamate synthase-like GNAT family acetyltransferase